MFLTEEDPTTEETEAEEEEDLKETNPALHLGPCPDDSLLELLHMYRQPFNSRSIYMLIHSLLLLQRPNKLTLFVCVLDCALDLLLVVPLTAV